MRFPLHTTNQAPQNIQSIAQFNIPFYIMHILNANVQVYTEK